MDCDEIAKAIVVSNIGPVNLETVENALNNLMKEEITNLELAPLLPCDENILKLIQQNRMNRPGLGDEFVNTEFDEVLAYENNLQNVNSVAVVTGFFISDAKPPAPETDGPSSSINLCYNLLIQGKRCVLLTEKCCFDLLSKTVQKLEQLFKFLPKLLVLTPESADFDPNSFDSVIFIEKVGFNAQEKCLSMRSRDVTQYNSEIYSKIQPKYSFGVGDGGNEIGCGKFKFLNISPKEIKCTIETGNTLLCDISNFGGNLLSRISSSVVSYHICKILLSEELLVQILVENGAVDGVKGIEELSVDGMDFKEYLNVIAEIWK